MIMPPGIRFKIVAAPQNLAKAHESTGWREAFDTLVRRVDDAMPFDVALVAAQVVVRRGAHREGRLVEPLALEAQDAGPIVEGEELVNVGLELGARGPPVSLSER